MPTKGFAPGPHFLFFREAKGSEKKLNGPAALVFASVCVYEQNRCFPMTVNSGLDQIQALVAVTGLK